MGGPIGGRGGEALQQELLLLLELLLELRTHRGEDKRSTPMSEH